MALVVTPKQLTHRSELYQQLSSLNAAGIGLIQALETLQRNPPDRSYRQPLGRILANLSEGATFAEALRTVENWMPSFDVALLKAGEKSGRLPNVLKLLAGYYHERAQLARQTLSAMAYPLFIFHFAILIGPFPQLFATGNLWVYAGQTLGVFVPLYALVGLVIYAAQGRHGEQWRSWLERVGNFIPLIGKARRALALARLSAALEALINAGVPIIEAWELAAAASGSPALRRAVVGWGPEVSSGTTPAEALSSRREFPELFTNLYHTGEISGQLDDTLKRLHLHYQDEGTRKLRAFAEWTPKLVYLGIMLMIAYRVVSFYQGYFDQINQVIHF